MEYRHANFRRRSAKRSSTQRSVMGSMQPSWGQVLQSYISSSFFHPFQAPAHRRIMHTEMRGDLGEPIAMLLVRLNDSSIVAPF